MKLIYCTQCGDIYNCDFNLKSCACGATKGVYINNEDVVYGGKDAICLGIDNNGFKLALNNQRIDGYAIRFDSYVCSMFCESTILIKDFEKSSEKELYDLLVFDNTPKRWKNELYRHRNGWRKFLYKIAKWMMHFSIHKLDTNILNPDLKNWYSNFTDRILVLATKLEQVTNKKYTKIQWFNFLFQALFKNPEYLIKWEKIKDTKDLYYEIMYTDHSLKSDQSKIS